MSGVRFERIWCGISPRFIFDAFAVSEVVGCKVVVGNICGGDMAR